LQIGSAMGELVVGDIVILASGGPAMTVADVMPWGEVFCIWFTPERRCAGEVFDARLLRRVSEPITDSPTAPIVATALISGPPELASGTPPLGYEAVPPRATTRDPGVDPPAHEPHGPADAMTDERSGDGARARRGGPRTP
jgi:uncharacterized protein YodC (DUF2158 family)